jgi:hypothetical protein
VCGLNSGGQNFSVAEFLQVLDRVEARLLIGDVDVEIVLFTVFVDRDPPEDQIVVIGRDDRTRFGNRCQTASKRDPGSASNRLIPCLFTKSGS